MVLKQQYITLLIPRSLLVMGETFRPAFGYLLTVAVLHSEVRLKLPRRVIRDVLYTVFRTSHFESRLSYSTCWNQKHKLAVLGVIVYLEWTQDETGNSCWGFGMVRSDGRKNCFHSPEARIWQMGVTGSKGINAWTLCTVKISSSSCSQSMYYLVLL